MIIHKYVATFDTAFCKLPPNKEGYGSYSILGYKLNGDVSGLRKGGWTLRELNRYTKNPDVEHLTPNFMDTWEKVT